MSKRTDECTRHKHTLRETELAIYTKKNRVSALADQDPSIADDEGIDWPVVMGHGEFVGGGDHLLSESEGHCWSQDSVSFFLFLSFILSCFIRLCVF